MRRQFILAKLLWRLVPGRLPFGPSHIGGLGDRRLLRIVVEDRAGDHRTARRPLPRREVIEARPVSRSEEHTSELQSRLHLVCRLLLEKKKKNKGRADTLFDA